MGMETEIKNTNKAKQNRNENITNGNRNSGQNKIPPFCSRVLECGELAQLVGMIMQCYHSSPIHVRVVLILFLACSSFKPVQIITTVI